MDNVSQETIQIIPCFKYSIIELSFCNSTTSNILIIFCLLTPDEDSRYRRVEILQRKEIESMKKDMFI